MCHGSDLCERFFRDLTKGVETSSPVCFSDECMGAGCVCCKWKAPHLCLYGTQICLIKSGGYPSHCLSSWNKYAPIHYHHRQLATLHRLFFFFLPLYLIRRAVCTAYLNTFACYSFTGFPVLSAGLLHFSPGVSRRCFRTYCVFLNANSLRNVSLAVSYTHLPA